MPSLFRIGKYLVFFWSNENNEPIHVHISEGHPTPNATKLWITSKGGCIVANNNSRIPNHELSDLMDIIEAQSNIRYKFTHRENLSIRLYIKSF